LDPENSAQNGHEPPQLQPKPSTASALDGVEGMAVDGDRTPSDSPCPGNVLADGSIRSFPPAHVQVDRYSALISGGIISALLCTIAILVDAFGELPPGYSWAPYLPLGLLLLFFALRAFWWPQLSHRHKSWSFSELGIHLTQGVIWRTTTSVPRARVQHTDVGQGPLQRRFGIATLSVHTAGSDQAQVDLSGLLYDDAIAVRDFLILKGPTHSTSNLDLSSGPADIAHVAHPAPEATIEQPSEPAPDE
jgi:uncharacterized protein